MIWKHSPYHWPFLRWINAGLGRFFVLELNSTRSRVARNSSFFCCEHAFFLARIRLGLLMNISVYEKGMRKKKITIGKVSHHASYIQNIDLPNVVGSKRRIGGFNCMRPWLHTGSNDMLMCIRTIYNILLNGYGKIGRNALFLPKRKFKIKPHNHIVSISTQDPDRQHTIWSHADLLSIETLKNNLLQPNLNQTKYFQSPICMGKHRLLFVSHFVTISRSVLFTVKSR